MREDEAQRGGGGQAEFGNGVNEVAAVRAEAVQPDDGGVGVGAGFEFEGVELDGVGHVEAGVKGGGCDLVGLRGRRQRAA